jgi:uncharacterized protein YpmS
MRKRLQLTVIALLAVVLCAGIALLLTYRSLKHVPPFYNQALAANSVKQEIASEELGSRATALYNDVRLRQKWEALFTDDQINGFLAVDLPEKHPRLLPKDVREPRVAITPEHVTLGFQVEASGVTTVFSVEADVYLSEPNVIALHLQGARAGKLPLPLQKVLDHISVAAQRLKIPLRWAQADGDPVALLTIEPTSPQGKHRMQLETLELHDGEVYVAGSSQKRRRGGEEDPAGTEPSPGHPSAEPDVASGPSGIQVYRH